MLTKEQRDERKARENLERLISKARMDFTFKKIQTFKQLLHHFGWSDDRIDATYFEHERNSKVTTAILNEYLSDRLIEFDTAIWLKHNPPDTTPEEVWKEGQALALTQPASVELTLVDPNLQDVKKAIVTDESNLHETERDYGFTPSPNEQYNPFWFQKKCISEALKKIRKGKKCLMIIAGVGTGKTFIVGGIIRRLIDEGFAPKHKSVSPWPYVYVTKASIVEQTKRVMKSVFNLTIQDLFTTNIDQLRSTAGELWVNEAIVVKNGEEVYEYQWRNMIKPLLLALDECQVAMNAWTSQSRIIQAFARSKEPGYMIWFSASPGTKVNHFKAFVLNCKIYYNLLIPKQIRDSECPGYVLINDETWPAWAKLIASPDDPNEYSPNAVDRLMDVLDDYIIRVKGVKPQFKAKNSIRLIHFITQEGKDFYRKAVERYKEKMAKALAGLEEGTITASELNVIKLVEFLQYRIAAESNPDRIEILGQEILKTLAEGKVVCLALSFKTTIIKLVKWLEAHGIPRDQISLIWGGGQTAPTKKQKKKAALEQSPELIAMLKEAGITMEDMDLEDVETKVEEKLDPSLRLGAQTLKERQSEIDKFQKGRTKVCMYTFKSGGVGLSLHHSDELTKEKVRKRKSGYAYVEDIPKIPTRPRKTYAAPTWSPIEIVQGLGRAARLTSLSDTEQELVFFLNTVEEDVAARAGLALRCLGKVVRQHEDWMGFISGDPIPEANAPQQLTNGDDDIPDVDFFDDSDENENS